MIGEALGVTERLGFGLLAMGYHPTHDGNSLPRMPKSRYNMIRQFSKANGYLTAAAYANGEVRQDGNSAQMLNPIVPMIQYMAGCFSLQAGDVILTGTPAGVGPLNVGDEVVLELAGVNRFESVVR